MLLSFILKLDTRVKILVNETLHPPINSAILYLCSYSRLCPKHFPKVSPSLAPSLQLDCSETHPSPATLARTGSLSPFVSLSALITTLFHLLHRCHRCWRCRAHCPCPPCKVRSVEVGFWSVVSMSVTPAPRTMPETVHICWERMLVKEPHALIQATGLI